MKWKCSSLVLSDSRCPIVVHERCLGFKARCESKANCCYASGQKSDVVGFVLILLADLKSRISVQFGKVERNERNVKAVGVVPDIPRFVALATRMEQYISGQSRELVDLGYTKITDKASILDEIIDYVRFLQLQVKFLILNLAKQMRLLWVSVRVSGSEHEQTWWCTSCCSLTADFSAEVVQETIDPNAEIAYRPNTEDDPHKRKPDITRAKELLGWEPKVSP